MRYRPTWAPDEIDIERPEAARMSDHHPGGSHGLAVDRAPAGQFTQAWPNPPHIVPADRAYLHRAVRHLVGAGVDQFLGLGSGIPAGGGMHDLSHSLNPAARTVYVDADPVAVAQSLVMLAGVGFASVVHADLRDVDTVLADPAVTSVLDLSRPVAVLMVGVLHFIPDAQDPAAMVAAYRDATAPGSYLVLSHAAGRYRPERTGQAEQTCTRTSHGMTFRDQAGILGLMPGYELVPPGLVDPVHWRPDAREPRPDPLGGDVTRTPLLAAVGRRK